MNLLDVKELTFAYPGREAVLQKVSFSLEAGQILSIIGPNGAGKSTLLHCLIGQLSPTSREILVQGRPLYRMSRREIAQFIGYVPQDQNPVFGYDVRTFVVMGRTPYISTFRMSSREDYRRADAVIEEMRIGHLAGRPYTEISGGERQQAASVPANIRTAYSQGFTDICSVKIFTTPLIRNFMQTKVQQHRVSTMIPQTVSVTSM